MNRQEKETVIDTLRRIFRIVVLGYFCWLSWHDGRSAYNLRKEVTQKSWAC